MCLKEIYSKFWFVSSLEWSVCGIRKVQVNHEELLEWHTLGKTFVVESAHHCNVQKIYN